MQSSPADEPSRVWRAWSFRAFTNQDAASIPILQRIGLTALAAEPEMLNGMSIGWPLAGGMVLVETKQAALTIIKRSLAFRICTNRKHWSLKAATGGTQCLVANLARTWTSGCSAFLKLCDFSRVSRAIVALSHCATAASNSSCVPER